MRKRILIVGGGIAGFAMAAFLERQGVQYDIIERAHSWRRAGYSITITPPALPALRQLGLYDTVCRLGQRMEAVDIMSGKNSHFVRSVSLRDQELEVYTMRRADLHRVLRDAVPSDKVRLGTTLERCTLLKEGVEVLFSDSPDLMHYDMVIGADGLHSTVRQHVSKPSRAHTSNIAYWTYMLPAAPGGYDPRRIRQLWKNGVFVGVFPLQSGAGVVLSARAGEISSGALKDRFAFLEDVLPGVLPGDYTEVYAGRLSEVKLSRWQYERVALIGDAAHAMMPATGMGSAMALCDAQALSEAMCRQEDFARAGALYEARRRTEVIRAQRYTRCITQAMLLDGAGGVLRNAAVSMMPSRVFSKIFGGE